MININQKIINYIGKLIINYVLTKILIKCKLKKKIQWMNKWFLLKTELAILQAKN